MAVRNVSAPREIKLAGNEKALSPTHTCTLNIVSNLGALYSEQGKLKEAEKIYRRALAGFEKAFGLDYTSTLDTVSNIAILFSWKGQLKEGRR